MMDNQAHHGKHEALHEVLRHPTRNRLTDLVRQQQSYGRVLKEIKREIDKVYENCRACTKAAELRTVPNFPALATTNLAVTLNAMDHRIISSKHKLLVMLDKGDQLLRLALLTDDTERTDFNV